FCSACTGLPQPRSRIAVAAETRAAWLASLAFMTPTRALMAVRVWLRASERISVRALGISQHVQGELGARTALLPCGFLCRSSLPTRTAEAAQEPGWVVRCLTRIRQAERPWRQRSVRLRLTADDARRPCRLGRRRDGLIGTERRGGGRRRHPIA